MEKSEFCVLIKHCFLMGKNSVQAKQWLDKCYSDSTVSETTVKRCYADVEYGHTDINETESSSHPNSAVVLGNTKKLLKLVLTDHKLKVCEIAKELKISENEHLFTVDQNQQCVDDSQCCFQLFQHNKKEFLHNYISIDETWIHHSQLNGQQQIKAIQSDHRHKHQQTRFQPPYFGMRKVFCSSITLRK